ncbi:MULTISPECIES: hypothetical protein [Acinetobacter calcoaceticus/baumannii complex]|uniref:hypothetical protein n=1 Tax=Acinetobacter calcoaceticus/baumannii complex TaxID=909768 RepID=UPI000A345DD0|nr:hypothetical protein [Acinetobacter pittii]OTL21973.1 hypothetical protein B9X79_01285 [Acinetobacter pittii]
MNNLLTASEAFAALQKGKTVLCRPAGDMLDFADLDQFPASVFGKTGFEFCIKIDVIELAGITFTKPLTVDELEVGTEVFVINPAGYIEKHVYQGVGYGIVTMVDGGFAQRDLDNARLQYEALCKVLGGNSIKDVPLKTTELEIENKQSKKRSKKEPQVKAEEPQVKEKTSEIIPVETQPVIVITEQTNVTTSEDLLVPETNKPKVDPEYQKNLDSLLQRVRESKTPDEVNAVYRYTRTWSDKQMEPLLLATHKRLEELEKEKSSSGEPPSLMVQIQNAPDLTTLDALEIDVAARDPQIQPKLMGYVRKRRFELENLAVSQPDGEPDYLLEEPF